MFFNAYVLLRIVFLKCVISIVMVNSQEVDVYSNILTDTDLYSIFDEEDVFLMGEKVQSQNEKVNIKLYYESLCPDCRNFDTKQLVPVVQTLASYLDIHPYPYGNAKTVQKDGKYEFICQHGPEECYGNKLHACAIELLNNMTAAVIFNACLMEDKQSGRGSTDQAVEICGKSMHLEPFIEPIKGCAKGRLGTRLLKHYGDESEKVGYRYVPYILINNVVNSGENFLRDVCAAFKNPPEPCKHQ